MRSGWRDRTLLRSAQIPGCALAGAGVFSECDEGQSGWGQQARASRISNGPTVGVGALPSEDAPDVFAGDPVWGGDQYREIRVARTSGGVRNTPSAMSARITVKITARRTVLRV